MLKKIYIICIIIIIILSLLYLITKHRYKSYFIPLPVILLSVESLRADHLGCYGYNQSTSPELDRLSRSSVLFANNMSSTSWTLPSNASLLTSLWQGAHDVIKDNEILSDTRITLAEVLQKEGFRTAAFVTGPYMDQSFNLDQGFDTYINCSYLDQVDENKGEKINPAVVENIYLSSHHDDIVNPDHHQQIISWLSQQQDSRFFLFLHYWDVHNDYIPPEPLNAIFDPEYHGSISARRYVFNNAISSDMAAEDLRHIIALYDGEIRWTDYYLGLLFQKLERAGLMHKALIVFTADHGEEFFEHGNKAHRCTLFDEVIRVPLLFFSKAVIRNPSIIENQTSSIHIAPTILDLLGISQPREFMGQSLRACFWDGSQAPPYALCELDDIFKVVRTNSWKIFYNTHTSRIDVFNLNQDPSERYASQNIDEETRNEAQHRLMEHLITIENMKHILPQPEKQVAPDLDPRTIEHLRSLGYIESEGESEKSGSGL
ncbi:sulfatase [bacterium]|nr:sulfatase [bacterium]